MLTITIISFIVALVSLGVAFFTVYGSRNKDRDDGGMRLHGEIEHLRQENIRQIDAVLSPLRTKIEDFSKNVRDSHIDATASRRSLSDQIERLMRLNASIGEEARNLAGALKGNSKIQGDWGETMLETILEREGLRKGINYDTQVTRDASGKVLRDEEGSVRRPDMVVYLPGDRSLIIDSKTSLSAYIDYYNASDPETAASLAKKHADSVRRHIDELSRVQYPKLVKGSAEYVVMFIPNDGAFMAATAADSGLWEYASRKKIVLASPSHLMAIVQLTSQLWREENQRTNAAEIARVAGLLYDKVAAFVADMKMVEKNINAAEAAYRNAYSKLTGGSQSVISRAERLRNLGAKVSKRISDDVVSDAVFNED